MVEGMSAIRTRKADHVRIVLEHDVEVEGSGLDCVRFVHRALPEIDRKDIDTTARVLGKTLRMPLLISAMTGGYPGAARINRALARAAQKHGIGLGLGSMRAMVEDASAWKTYAVRDVAPDVLLIGNIGLPQLTCLEFGPIVDVMEKVGVDAVAVHLNPLHEATQPEGETGYAGGLAAIQEFKSQSKWPVVVKETGAGISKEVASRLQRANVEWVDVAGLGGTSFAAVESYRAKDPVGRMLARSMSDWGIPTAASVAEVAASTSLNVIASGGIRGGLDAAKCISLGARCAGIASPFLKAVRRGEAEVDKLVRLFHSEILASMFLTGSRNLDELRGADLVISGWLRNWMVDRGVDPLAFSRRSPL